MSRFKIVIAGCGRMSNDWIRYVLKRKDAEIVAFVDLFLESAKAKAVEFAVECACFTDISEAIKATGANLVLDVTVPEAHKDITIAALSSGCDIFGEKPMAATMEECEEVLRVARKSAGRFSVMQNRRYNKMIRAYRELVTGGTIGQAGMITADFFLAPHFGGFRDQMDSPLILDMAIHTFDQARFITNADPVSVYCHEFNPAGSWYKGNAAAVCIFEFSNGAVFTYNGSWCAEGAGTSWESAWRTVGSLGTAIWDGSNVPYCEVVVNPGETSHWRQTKRIEAELTWKGENEGHHGCLDEMFAALIEGREAETICTDNIKSMAMVFGALESAKTGKKVNL